MPSGLERAHEGRQMNKARVEEIRARIAATQLPESIHVLIDELIAEVERRGQLIGAMGAVAQSDWDPMLWALIEEVSK